MPFFSKVFKPKDPSKSKGGKHHDDANGAGHALPTPHWEESWTRKEVAPEEVQELIHVCTQEMKSRALDTPFLLLPFRPGSDANTARNIIKSFFRDAYERGTSYSGESLQAELRLTEPMVLCSIMKWCWSRLPGGVVTWDAYELFRSGEQDSGMAMHAFDTFIPLSVESDARKQIIVDFFDLLAAVSARGKTNGLGGRKLSRMAGWWAFEHSDSGKGFDGGYKSWANAADATSHLFFAYLRSLSPDDPKGISGISNLPRSLQALVSQTEYPPETPVMMQTTTSKVVMIVNSVSPTPFALLRRAKNFEYRQDDRVLQQFATYDDPVQALTEECRRVLNAISSTNQSTTVAEGSSDPSWSRFEDLGFGFLEGPSSQSQPGSSSGVTTPTSHHGGLRTAPGSRTTNMGRPTTPSWADFLSTGFVNEQGGANRSPMLLPPDKILPPIGEVARVQSSQSHLRLGDAVDDLEPGELASVARFDFDETFWWVWMTSLAGEEPNERKAVFGRCALIETTIAGGRWLVVEEQVKGASTGHEDGAYIVEKKSKFSFTKRGRLGRRKSTGKKPPLKEPYDRSQNDTPMSKTSIGPDQHARIQAAAARLAQEQRDQTEAEVAQRRGRTHDPMNTKTNSVMTLQPMVMNEAAPAMKWAKNFDKEAIRRQYLGDISAGRGGSHENLAHSPGISNGAPSPRAPSTNHELPPLPTEEPKPQTPKDVQRKALRTPVSPRGSGADVASTAAQVPLPDVEKSKIGPDDDVHPALRQESRERKAGASGSAVNEKRKMFEQQAPTAATIAAKKAFGNPPSSPEAHKGEPKKLKKQTGGGGGGFKKLFGKKKAAEPKKSVTSEPVAQEKSDGLAVPQQSGLGRSFSNMRKKPAGTPEPNPPMRDEAALVGEQPPPVSRVHTDEQQEADEHFSQFDQGPLEDVPAFVPEDADDEARTPQASHFNTQVSEPVSQEASQADVSADDISEASIDIARQISPTQDRWARIRKNAAERAVRMSEDQARPRYSEDQSRPRHSESQSTRTDDGDTSGEETIESRVARIKARVAELTGNMDTSGNIVTGARR